MIALHAAAREFAVTERRQGLPPERAVIALKTLLNGHGGGGWAPSLNAARDGARLEALVSEQHTELQWLRGILWAILFISLCGMTFSGTLTYREVFGTAASCPSPGAAGTIFGYPACVYGLAMYALS